MCKDDTARSIFVSQVAPACLSFATPNRARARSTTSALIVDRASAVLAQQLPHCKHDVHASAGRRPCLLDTACDALAWRPGIPGVVSMHFSVVQLLAMAVATRGADPDSVACACDQKMIGALLQCLDKYWAELTGVVNNCYGRQFHHTMDLQRNACIRWGPTPPEWGADKPWPPWAGRPPRRPRSLTPPLRHRPRLPKASQASTVCVCRLFVDNLFMS